MKGVVEILFCLFAWNIKAPKPQTPSDIPQIRPLALRLFLVGIGDADWSVAQELPHAWASPRQTNF